MRFSTIFLSTVVAALSVQAQANNGTATTESPAVSGTALPTPGQLAATRCLATCKSSTLQSRFPQQILTTFTGPSNDNDCRAKCQLLANSVNPIGDCQAACPKGDGSAAGNLSYKECLQGCNALSPVPSASETSSAASSTSTGSGFYLPHTQLPKNNALIYYLQLTLDLELAPALTPAPVAPLRPAPAPT